MCNFPSNPSSHLCLVKSTFFLSTVEMFSSSSSVWILSSWHCLLILASCEHTHTCTYAHTYKHTHIHTCSSIVNKERHLLCNTKSPRPETNPKPSTSVVRTHTNYITSLSLIDWLPSPGDPTQGLISCMQVFYHWAAHSTLIFFIYKRRIKCLPCKRHPFQRWLGKACEVDRTAQWRTERELCWA